ncbi:MAG: 3-oxoacyl-[acyl-carrier-protein] reductase [Candidatus Humimicrobiaceae bacterium]
MKLKGKVSIVTGGARGIGKKITEYLLKEGSTVYFFDIDDENGKKTQEEFSDQFGKENVYYFNVDITNENDVKNSMAKIVDEKGAVDILVNNAGITRDNLVLRMSLEDWKKVIEINLTGAFICTKNVIKSMIKSRQGKIINISSIVGLHGNAGQSNYSAAKAGLVGLTKSVAKELAGRNIQVNAIAPGYINTEMTRKLPGKVKEKLIDLIPSGRLGAVEDIAKVVVFLAGEESNYITGFVVNVDGGMGI